jgi:hypothetical protein
MKNTLLIKLLVLIWPVAYPIFLVYKEKDNVHNYAFLILFFMQWAVYFTFIENIPLAFFISNVAMLFLLLINPYWSYDINICFGKKSREYLQTPYVRIIIISIILLLIPPFLGKAVVSIVKIFFINEELFLSKDIAIRYLNWTWMHTVASWLLLVCWSILQLSYDLEFQKFLFGWDFCGEENYEVSSVVFTQIIIALFLIMIYAFVLGIRYQLGFVYF